MHTRLEDSSLTTFSPSETYLGICLRVPWYSKRVPSVALITMHFKIWLVFIVVFMATRLQAKPAVHGGHGNKSYSSRVETCNLESYKGNCRAFMPRYRYNPDTHKCERFIYGGCGANANNFYTEQHCMQFCKGVQKTSA